MWTEINNWGGSRFPEEWSVPLIGPPPSNYYDTEYYLFRIPRAPAVAQPNSRCGPPPQYEPGTAYLNYELKSASLQDARPYYKWPALTFCGLPDFQRTHFEGVLKAS